MLKKIRMSLLTMLLMVATIAQAQVTTSSMSGRITDREGAVIGATVVATHEPSGTTYGTVTNVNGNYTLLGLRTGGPYRLEISYVGYDKMTFNKIYLQLGETSVFNAKMKEDTQQLSEVIVVGDRAAAFNSRKTGAATNFSKSSIEATPNVSRSIYEVAKLTPQATVTGSGISFTGSNNRYNSFQIDGTVNNDVFGLSSSGTNGGQSGSNPISLEAIDEIQVVIAPFDVRQSGFTGGGVNAITKAGTNKFHGSLYGFFNNQNFVGTTPGKDIEERKKLGEQSSRTLGFTIGGPILRDKLFFFANYENVNETYPSSYNIGEGSDITKDEADKVINKLKEISGGYDGGGYGVIDIPTKSNKFLTRIDWNINNMHKFTARYSYLDASRLNFSNSKTYLSLNNHGYNMNNKTHSIVTELNSRFNPSLSNELRLGYTRVRDNREIMGQPFPYINVKLDNNRSIQIGTERYSPANYLNQDIYTIEDNLSILRGDHQITFGTHNEFFKMTNLFIRENFGSYVYTLSNFMNIGTPLEATSAPDEYNYSFSREDITGSKNWAPTFGAAQLGFYAQDDWSVSDLFKLTYGLRLDIPLFYDKPTANDKFNALDVAQKYGVATDQMPKTRILFSPRLGFRYSVDETRNTLIRGGVGIFTGRVPFVWISNSFSNTGVEYARTQLKYNSDPKKDQFASAIVDGFKFQADPVKQYVPSKAFSSEVDVMDKNFKFPQVFRVNLALEQNMPGGVKGTLEGLYSKTLNNIKYSNLAYEYTGNNLSNGTGDSRPLYKRANVDYKDFSDIIYLTNTNKGYTYSLTGKLEKNFDFGLNAMLAYTFGESKGINDGTSSQASSNWKYNEVYGGDDFTELSYTDFDVRHRIVGSLNYKVEYGGNFATTIGLVYNGQSGSRYSMVYYGDLNGDGATGNDLMYVPTDSELAKMSFDKEEQRTQLGQWINNNEDIAKLKGKYIPRNGLVSEFEHHFDLHLAQDFYFDVSGQRNTIQLNFDILNVGNLFNRGWGLYQSPGYSYSPMSYKNGVYGFSQPKGDKLYNISDYLSRWRGQIGLKYIF